MEPLSTTSNNIRKKNKDYRVEADPKRNMALSLQAPRGSRALAAAIPDHVTQSLVREAKKLLEFEVLMSYPFPSEKEQEEMITRSWNTSQTELGHVRSRTKPVDQQFHQTICSSRTKVVTLAKLHILDFYDLNDMDTSSRKAQVEYLLKHDRFICRTDKAEVWANLYIIYLCMLGNCLSSSTTVIGSYHLRYKTSYI